MNFSGDSPFQPDRSARLHGNSSATRQPRPLYLWQIFPLVFICVYLTHATLLRLPYYWDEAGYYIPAAYDFLRTGSLIPYSTLSNAHPPLPSLYLALWWKASGFIPFVTRVAVCVVSSIALLGVYQLVLQIARRWQIAASVTALTLLYPVWFAQSTLAHADIFAAAATLWGLCFYFKPLRDARNLWLAAFFFSLAALSKETAIVTPFCLAAGELAWPSRPVRFVNAGILVTPLIPLAAWYSYHRYKTGFVFGNPEYLRYNATATLSPLRVTAAFAHRVFHLTAHMNLFVPVLCALAAFILAPRILSRDSTSPLSPLDPSLLRPLWIILLGNTIFFSVMGGALLTRYLLPLYPIVLLLCVWTWHRRVRGWGLLFVLSAAAFTCAIFLNPPYRFSPEDNLSYRDSIVLAQAAIHELSQRYPNASVLSAWPVSDDLAKPELGYVRKPWSVVSVNDFTLASIQRAGESNANFTAALIFNTKDDDNTRHESIHLPFGLSETNRALDTRFFNEHQDLDPDAIARLLGGRVAWQERRNGQWAAIVHFDRPQLAHLRPPSTIHPGH